MKSSILTVCIALFSVVAFAQNSASVQVIANNPGMNYNEQDIDGVYIPCNTQYDWTISTYVQGADHPYYIDDNYEVRGEFGAISLVRGGNGGPENISGSGTTSACSPSNTSDKFTMKASVITTSDGINYAAVTVDVTW